MSDARSNLADFLLEFSGACSALPDDADVFSRLGIEGDDAVDFMDKFAVRFAVDVSGYRWYFHHADEGWNIGGLFFAPPYGRVERIPITPRVLAEAIQTRQWPLQYPDHALPRHRWDMRLNQFLVVLVLIAMVVLVSGRFVR